MSITTGTQLSPARAFILRTIYNMMEKAATTPSQAMIQQKYYEAGFGPFLDDIEYLFIGADAITRKNKDEMGWRLTPDGAQWCEKNPTQGTKTNHEIAKEQAALKATEDAQRKQDNAKTAKKVIEAIVGKQPA